MKQETIAGEGILLRPWTDDDIDDVALACDDPVTARFLPFIPSPYTRESARWWVQEGAPRDWENGGAAFAVVDMGTQKLLAGVGIGSVLEGKHQGEAGYWVAPWARGRGVATRATVALADWAFRNGFYRLELLIANENYPSQRVALNAGFAREGVRRHHGTDREGNREDLIAFARLADDPSGPIARLLPDLPGGHLSDGDLRLRPVGPGDVDDYFALATLPDVRDTWVGAPLTRELAARRCINAPTRWLAGEMAAMTIEVNGEFAGDISLHYQQPRMRQAMIGYSLRPEFRGKGVMTRAVNLITDWALETVGVVRVIAGTFPDNVASQRVLERAGFEREAYQRAMLQGPDGNRIDNIQYVRLASMA